MKDPDVNNGKIVFSYEGDLWLVSTNGGTACRLTTAPGNEYSPKFSPDGSLIAFTGNYDGSNNVYVMPVTAVSRKELLIFRMELNTIAWTPDGKRIVFASYYESFVIRDPMLYFANKDGSAPEKLPIRPGTPLQFFTRRQ